MILNTGQIPDLMDKNIKKIHIKDSMPHKDSYNKKEIAIIKEKSIKSGTKKAHTVLKSRRKMLSEGGYMYS